MRVIKVKKEDLEKVVKQLTEGLREPLFRGLGGQAQDDFERFGYLQPYDGNMSVGTGVFFTNDLNYAAGLMHNLLVICAREALDPEHRALDTRKPGYDAETINRLNMELGKDNYNGWTIWQEIQKNDTITFEGGPESCYVFTRRKPVTQNEILAIIDVSMN